MEEKIDKIFIELYNNSTDGKAWDKAKAEIIKLLKL